MRHRYGNHAPPHHEILPTVSPPLAIEVVDLTKTFEGNTQALGGVTFSVPAGTVCGLLGHNGAGKTTTINILSTLIRPTSGHAMVAGYDVVTQAHRVRANIGLTGQYAAVDELLTVRGNLIIVGRLSGIPLRTANTPVSG